MTMFPCPFSTTKCTAGRKCKKPCESIMRLQNLQLKYHGKTLRQTVLEKEERGRVHVHPTTEK